jgi:RimJ/RimL family protein N-acetyltransferase
MPESIDSKHVVELGFHLLPRAWGHGFATEAARTALDFAPASEVYSGHHPENSASRNVLGKLGFQQIGEMLYPPTGLIHPWYRVSKPQ